MKSLQTIPFRGEGKTPKCCSFAGRTSLSRFRIPAVGTLESANTISHPQKASKPIPCTSFSFLTILGVGGGGCYS